MRRLVVASLVAGLVVLTAGAIAGWAAYDRLVPPRSVVVTEKVNVPVPASEAPAPPDVRRFAELLCGGTTEEDASFMLSQLDRAAFGGVDVPMLMQGFAARTATCTDVAYLGRAVDVRREPPMTAYLFVMTWDRADTQSWWVLSYQGGLLVSIE